MRKCSPSGISATVAFVCGTFAGCAHAADIGLAIKGGGVSLSSDRQRFEGQDNDFDSFSSRAFALAWDVRHPRANFGVGMEYLYYVNPYHSSVFAGKASTRALLLTGKYYFPARRRSLRPFIGAGLGTGYVSNHSEDVGDYSRCDTCVQVTAFQIGGGMEWGGPRLGLIAELKLLTELDGINNNSSGHFDSGYDASGLGLFVGARMLF